MRKIFVILLSLVIMASATSVALAFEPADGTYSADTWWEGGTGKASIVSPAAVTVSGGSIYLNMVLTSTHYTWVETQGIHVNNENPGGNSTFTIPVPAFDTPFEIVAETTAMSQPHEITYYVTVSSSGIPQVTPSGSGNGESQSQSTAPNKEDPSQGDDGGKAAEEAIKEATKEEKPEKVDPVLSVKDGKALDDENTVNKINKFSTSTSISKEELKDCMGKSLHLATSKGSVYLNKDIVNQIIEEANGGITLVLKDLDNGKGSNEDSEDANDGLIKGFTFLIKDDEERDLLQILKNEINEEDIVINIPINIEDEFEAMVKTQDGEEDLEWVYRDGLFCANMHSSGEIQLMNVSQSSPVIYIIVGIIIVLAVAFILKKKKNPKEK